MKRFATLKVVFLLVALALAMGCGGGPTSPSGNNPSVAVSMPANVQQGTPVTVSITTANTQATPSCTVTQGSVGAVNGNSPNFTALYTPPSGTLTQFGATVSCTAGGASNSATTNIQVPATITPATLLPSPINQGQTATDAITLGGNPLPTQVTCVKNNAGDPGTISTCITTAVAYTAPASVTAGFSVDVTVSATNGIGATASAKVTFTVNGPTLTITAPANNATLVGASVLLSASVPNPPTGAQVLFSQKLSTAAAPTNIATVTVANNAASTIWDTTKVSNGTYTLTMALVGTSATASVTVTVSNPVPTITSITPADLYCPPGGCGVLGGFLVTGANFTSPFSVLTTGVKGCTPTFQDPTHFSACLIVDSSSNPGDVTIIYQNQSGTASNPGRVFFLGFFNTQQTTETEHYLADQGNQKVVVYNRLSGLKAREWSKGNIRSFSVDNQTGKVVYTSSAGNQSAVISVTNNDGDNLQIATNPQGGGTEGVVQDALACISQEQAGILTFANITANIPVLLGSVNTGTRPVPVAMAKAANGNHLCSALDIENNVFYVVEVETQTIKATGNLNGFTKASQVPLARGNWQLAAFQSRPLVAYLSVFDRKVDFLNRDTGVEVRSVDLSSLGGVPGRIEPNEADGTLMVAVGDPATGLTKLVKVNPDTGAMAVQGNTANFFGATGIRMSADGKTAFISSRGNLPVSVNTN